MDKEIARKGLRYVRYADDFSIYTKSKAEAPQFGNEIFIYLRDKLRLPINRTKCDMTLDEWLRNRLRYCIWTDWKKLDRRRKYLVRLGISQGQGYAWSRTKIGGWAVAQSPILRTTITLSGLRRKGYESMLSLYLKPQPQIQ